MGEHQERRVVVIGGGFAGAFAAKRLRKRLPPDIGVDLISERNYFVFQPLLPEVVGGTITATDAVTPLRLMLPGVHVRMGEVVELDPETQRLTLIQGSKRIPQQLNYEALVLALGTRPNAQLFPGLAEHGFTVKNLTDAQGLRNHIIHCLEHADVTENLELKQALLTFVVAGGGFSGVEVAGEVQEMIQRSLRHYPNLKRSDVQIILVHSGERVLPELGESLGKHAEKRLAKRGVTFMFGERLSRATATAAYTSSGQRIETHTLVSTIGNGPVALVESLELERHKGRLLVDSHLKVPQANAVWAIGDNAWVPSPDAQGATSLARSSEPPPAAPTTAQFAVREAQQAADNIVAELTGKGQGKPFSYQPKGSMASIGHYDAVAEVYGLPVAGIVAWLLWRGFYWSLVPGLSTKLRIALNWMFDYVLPRSIVQIARPDDTGLRRVHYSAGDVLFEPGQRIDGLYAVVSGAIESRIVRTNEEDHVRLIGAGQHWGEHSFRNPQHTRGHLVALEDSEVLVVRRADFGQLSAALPFFDEYFATLPEPQYPRELRTPGDA